MITPYGAVLENNNPSPWEVQKYNDEKVLQEQALKLKKAALLAEQKKAADAEHARITKPLAEYKVNTGITGTDEVKPDLVVGKKVQEALSAVEAMYKAGKPETEINQYISSSVRDLDTLQNSFKNGLKDLEGQLATVKEGDGVDPNKVRELMTVEMLGRKPGSDNSHLLINTLQKYPEALTVNNSDKLYNFPMDAAPNSDFHKAKGPDGSIGFRQISTKYNSMYQDLKQNPDYSFEVVTKSEPAEINGKAVKVLPEPAYQDLRSNIGRMVQIEQGVKKELAGIKWDNEWEANKQAGQQLYRTYGDQLKKMPAAERLKRQRELKNRIVETMDVPDEEVVRRKVAYDLADQNIAKAPVSAQVQRNPNIRNITHVHTAGETRTEDVYKEAMSVLPADGSAVPVNAVPDKLQGIVLAKIKSRYGSEYVKPDYDSITVKRNGDKIEVYYGKETKPVVSYNESDLNLTGAKSVKERQEVLKHDGKGGTTTVTPTKGKPY